jgi:iron-sulfur cluster repair protein YtfE (RIC family)
MDASGGSEVEQPIEKFSACHAGIKAQLQELTELPRLLEQAQRARGIAEHALRLLDQTVLVHHADEESALFPAVQRGAQAGAEADQVTAIVARLTEEHRTVERSWKALHRAVKDAALGKPAHLDAHAVNALVALYLQHANFEERVFLPLAEKILGRDDNHMAALGMSLHMRHAKVPVAPYI